MSNMGTVEKIVEVLGKMGCDKKAQATARYQEHSTWLSTEFSSIRNLIQPLPHSLTHTLPESTTTTTTTTSEVSNAASRQKRKSPETCSQGYRNSPLHKRNSGGEMDITALLLAQNLPSDLNKLKKDQLLEQINAKTNGNHELTMKNLKKEMIETLKSCVMNDYRKNIPNIKEELSKEELSNEKEESQEQMEMPETEVEVETEAEVEAEVIVKEEVMVEVKLEESEVVTDTTCTAVSEESEDRDPIQQEDKSQKDQILCEETVTVDSNIEDQSENQSEVKPSIEEQSDVSDVVTEEQSEDVPPPLPVPGPSSESPRKQSILSEYRQQMTSSTTSNTASVPTTAIVRSSLLRPKQGGETAEDRNARVQSEFEARKLRHRMSQVGRKSDVSASSSVISGGTELSTQKEEVSCEKATPSEEELPLQSLMQTTVEPSNLTVEMEMDDDDDSNWNEVPSPKRGNSDESLKEDVVQTDKTAVKVEPITQVVKEKTVEKKTTEESAPARPLSVKSVTSDAGTKNPTNLVGGNQLSFLSSSKPTTSAPAAGVKSKTAVPALAMAARQKEKEEARALLKKKELEEKKREHLRKMQQQKSGSSRTLGASTKPSVLSHATSGAATKTATEKSFGWALGKKKEDAVTEDTKENKVTAPVPVASSKVASSSSSASSTSSSGAVLTEKKINPAEYRQVTPSKPPTPQQMQQPQQSASTVEVSPPREEYKIEDDDDDSDSGSGTDEDDDDDKKKQIPDWAKGPKLREALEKQYGLNGHTAVDPDQIFFDVQTCSLEDIFGKREGKCGKYSVRTSSAKWDEDEITLVEKRKYRNQMGYI